MLARDGMIAPVLTVKPSATVQDVARLFTEKRISAAPVIDQHDKLVGIISESDLIHRAETGIERKRSWWLQQFVDPDRLASFSISSLPPRRSAPD